GVDVALHRNGVLGAGEAVGDGSGAGRLRLVPLAVVLGHRVGVVSGLVVVLHFDVLSSHDRDHVGIVHAALLIARLGRRWSRESVVGRQAILDVDDDVGQRALIAGDNFGRNDGARVGFLAIRFGAHVDGLGGRCGAVEVHGAGDGAGS